MKRIISITIALCLVFCSILPVYAEAWTSQQASTVTSNSTGILSQITNLNSLFTQFFTIRNISGGNVTATFQDFYDLFSSLCTWIIPSNPSQTGLSLWDFSLLIATRVNDLWSGWDSYFSNLTVLPSLDSRMVTNNSFLSQLRDNLANVVYYTGEAFNQQKFAHLQLPWVSSTSTESYYRLYDIGANGINTLKGVAWINGSPLGNLAVMLNQLIENDAKEYNYRWIADLKHYNDNLTTWDSQGSTLSQVAFTPESAIQGLYRYLAFTQRDVARLAYVFANDEELEARELAQANQEQVLDDFIDPNGSGSVSTTDLGSMSDASNDFKSNFSTNVGSSHIWDVFDNSRYNWFTQQTKNQLDTTPQTRQFKAVQNDYPTPLLDNYYDEISRLIGVDIND